MTLRGYCIFNPMIFVEPLFSFSKLSKNSVSLTILFSCNSKGEIGRATDLQNHGHITTENDFPAV